MKYAQVVMVVAVAGLLGGCGSEPGISESSPATALDMVVNTALADARNAGAEPEQIRLIEEAREAGGVTYEVLVEAYDGEIQCVEDAGIPTEAPYSYERFGVKQYSYGTRVPEGMTDETQGAITWRCAEMHRVFLEYVYANQPSSTEAYDALVEAALPEIRSCLAREGVDDAELLTVDEALSAAVSLEFDQMMAGDPDSVDCLAEAGVG